MNRKTASGKVTYKRRKETVERSFADAKQLHGHRYVRFRGLVKVQWQCLLNAAGQNIEIAMAMTKAQNQLGYKGFPPPKGAATLAKTRSERALPKCQNLPRKTDGFVSSLNRPMAGYLVFSLRNGQATFSSCLSA